MKLEDVYKRLVELMEDSYKMNKQQMVAVIEDIVEELE